MAIPIPIPRAIAIPTCDPIPNAMTMTRTIPKPSIMADWDRSTV
jgi:hypothetical protein